MSEITASDEMYKTELTRLYAAVDMFAEKMKRKLRHKLVADGLTGWDNPVNADHIRNSLRTHTDRLIRNGSLQAVDVANFAMMLYMMTTPRNRVFERFPYAVLRVEKGVFNIYPILGSFIIGSGETAKQAWAAADKYIEDDY